MARSKTPKKSSGSAGKSKAAARPRFSRRRLALLVLSALVAVGAALAFLPVVGVGLRIGAVSLTGGLAPPSPPTATPRPVDYELGRSVRGGARVWRVRVRNRVWMLRVG
jgi:hypothetical protein